MWTKVVTGVDEVLQESIARANRLLTRGANGKALRKLLEQADADLKQRLIKAAVAHGGGKPKASEAALQSYSKQAQLTIEYVKQRLKALTHDQALTAIQGEVKKTAADLQQLDVLFTGVVTPLRLREAATLAGVADKAFKPLMAQHATSVDRYGEAMTGEVRRILRQGLMVGATNGQLVEALVGHGGPKGRVSLAARVDPATGKVVRLKEADIPEGLFARKRYWAQRLVRTEVAHAQNEARLDTIFEATKEFPDMGKKILATFDNRTALDSIGVHGQVRKPNDLFMDGAGRQYLRPPARPNDRETIVPWRLSWSDTPYTAPVPAETVAKLQASGADVVQGSVDHQLKVQQALEHANAKMKTEGAEARSRVETLIATKLAQLQQPAAHHGPTQALMAQAKAQQQAAVKTAQLAVEAAETATIAKVQKHVLAQSKIEASKAAIFEQAKAKAEAYKAVVAAQKAAKLAEEAAQLIESVNAIVKMGIKPEIVYGTSIKILAKNHPEKLEAVWKALGGKGKATAPKVGQKLGIYTPKPKKPKAPPEPEKPYRPPDPAFVLEGKYTHKKVDKGGGSSWLDVYDTSGVKKAFVIETGQQWEVNPPDYLQAKGWEPKKWPTPAGGGAPSGLNAATHYALQVSKAIQDTKSEAEKFAAEQNAKKAAELAEARKNKRPAWSPKWKGAKRPIIEGESPSEALRKRWTKASSGVGVHADGGAIEDLALQFRSEVEDGKEMMVVRFKLTASVADQQVKGAFAEGETRRRTSYFFQRSERSADGIVRERRSTGMEAPGIESVLERSFGTATVSILRGSGAMANAVEVRMPMPKGDRFKPFEKIANAMGLDVSAPSAAALQAARRARIMASLDTKASVALNQRAKTVAGALGHEEINALWEKHATQAMREIDADAKMCEVAPGRVGFYSEKLAQRLADAGVKRLTHNVAGGADVYESMFGDEQSGGLLSSRERWTRGIFTQGMSSGRDFITGGADSFFVRVSTEIHPSGIDIDPSELGRLDWYHVNRDTYGNTGDEYRRERTSLEEMERMARAGSFSGGNEAMVRTLIPVTSIRRVALGSGERRDVLKRFAARGVHAINGVPVDEFFVED